MQRPINPNPKMESIRAGCRAERLHNLGGLRACGAPENRPILPIKIEYFVKKFIKGYLFWIKAVIIENCII